MTRCDEFFASKATVFVGERFGAEAAAADVVARLAAVGVVFERVLCLQHEHLQLYHRGLIYTFSDNIDGFLDYADLLRKQNLVTILPQQASLARTAPTRSRIELRDHRHAVGTLTPLIGRRMRLTTRDGLLAFGNWWFGSLDAGTFEVASDFGLFLPACGYDKLHKPYTHVVLEVWPTASDGERLNGVDDKSHTTMIHVPFGHDIALHLVEDDGMSGAKDRTDNNLRRMFR